MQAKVNRRVLILGCGTIGRIKALLWLRLGCAVYVYDNNASQMQQILRTDSRLKPFDSHLDNDIDLVDISTPNDQHAICLRWTFETIPDIKTVLIEKPICSNAEDKVLIEDLLHKNNKALVYVNETYFWSDGLKWIRARLRHDHDQITDISINLSKNRLADLKNGRFFDHDLESYGIELPHAYAILQTLDFSLDALVVEKNINYKSQTNLSNQGLSLQLKDDQDRFIQVFSFLGNFRVVDGHIMKNHLERSVRIKTKNGREYKVEFDPAPGLDRYKSRITVDEKTEFIVDDNHMKTHLKNALHGVVDDRIAHYLSPSNSLKIYDLIKSKSDGWHIEFIPDNVISKYTVVGEGVGAV